MRRLLYLALVSLIPLTAACDDAGADATDPALFGAALTDGSPESLGVLALLNDPATTLAMLDDDARLDRRAAAGLIAYRDGADGRPGTADDQRFSTLAQVDAVKWVGASALGRLAFYAEQLGYVQLPDGLLGTYDDVPFTVDQADAALALVNTAGQAQLDDDVALNSRAVKSIIAARPIGSMESLASLYYVGRTALLRIRDYAGATLPAVEAKLPAGSDCLETAACEAGLRCQGIPHDGSSTLGKCVSVTALIGEGDHCDGRTPCNGSQQCAGTTVWGDGQCVAPWMAGTFRNDGWRTIRDSEVPWDCGDSCPSVSSSVVVYGLASVPVDIVVTVQIDHAKNRDLRVTLTDPNGDVAVLWENSDEVGDGLARSFVTNGISRDDSVNGQWTLTVSDTEHGGAGTLKGWDLFVVSRWD